MRQDSPYTITLRWSEPQHVFIAQVQELPGCEGSGATYETALASVLEAIRWWHEASGEGEASPFSQMLSEEEPSAPEGK